MKHVFNPKGVCSKQIDFELDGNIVKNVEFQGGCHGNLQGISALSEGQPAEELIKRMEGIKCGPRSTSCPDQFCHALREALEKEKRADSVE